jgi:hypothetical protein
MRLQDSRVQLIACLPSLMHGLAAYACMREKVLLGSAALIIEANDPVRLHRHVGDDKTNPREQLFGVAICPSGVMVLSDVVGARA